jgi:transcriptional regulator with XRE-family HTH domain
MRYDLEEIADQLRQARIGKSLSQRDLSAMTGLTQANISKIENAAADVKFSTLIQIARALDLEVMLVPSKAVPAVQGVVRFRSQEKSHEAMHSTLFEEDAING